MSLSQGPAKRKPSKFCSASFLSGHGLAQTFIWKDKDDKKSACCCMCIVSLKPIEMISHPPQLLVADLERRPLSWLERPYSWVWHPLSGPALVAKRLAKPLSKPLRKRLSLEFFCLLAALTSASTNTSISLSDMSRGLVGSADSLSKASHPTSNPTWHD